MRPLVPCHSKPGALVAPAPRVAPTRRPPGPATPGSLGWVALMAAALSGCGGGGAADSSPGDAPPPVGTPAPPPSAPPAGPPASPSPAPAPPPDTPAPPPAWQALVEEGASFEAIGPQLLRFGQGERWVEAQFEGVQRCDSAAFGADPSPGAAKACEVAPSPAAPTVALLSWDASADSRVTGYRVYRGQGLGSYLQAPGSGLPAGAGRQFAVAGLAGGQTHYFAVTAVDGAGGESVYSNEASKQAP